MSTDEHERLRTSLWDHLFAHGPQSIEQLAEAMQLSVPTVVVLADHEWFSACDNTVKIATDG